MTDQLLEEIRDVLIPEKKGQPLRQEPFFVGESGPETIIDSGGLTTPIPVKYTFTGTGTATDPYSSTIGKWQIDTNTWSRSDTSAI